MHIRSILSCLVLVVIAGCSTAPIPAPPDVAAPPADAVRTPTNLASKVLTRGTGSRHPRPNSRVTVHYTGWTTDGKMFESSVQRGAPRGMLVFDVELIKIVQ